MTQQETIDRILVEIRTHSIPASENYIPTKDHYVPLRLVTYYLELAYTAGFDARNEYIHNHNSKRIAQIEDGKVIQIYNSIELAAKKMGVNHKSISVAAYNSNRTCKGFHWKFII